MSAEPRPTEPGRPRRPRRFVVRDHEDHKVTEKIEAFLAGPRPGRSRRKRATVAKPRPPLDTRTDFAAALRLEHARAERYGRPVAIGAVAFGPDVPASASEFDPRRAAQPGRIDQLAGPIGTTLRREARDTDRVARVGPDRFHVLLPETSATDAERFVERVRRACEAWSAETAQPVRLRIETAAPDATRTLADALAAVEERLSA